MSERILQNLPPQPDVDKGKPLSRLQAYLKETKVCISLLRDVLLEFKELLVAITIIVFFLIGVSETLAPIIKNLLLHLGLL